MSVLDLINSDSKLLALIQDAVLHALQVHTHSMIEIGPTFFRSSVDKKNLGVIGLVHIKGNSTPAFLAIGFSEAAFLQIYKNMFKEELGGITLEAADLAGEIVNIIFQTLDPELRNRGFEFEVSFPEVHIGTSESKSACIQYQRSLVLPFRSGKEDFYFEIAEIPSSVDPLS
jgi:CheY-specific phosphatase CheX